MNQKISREIFPTFYLLGGIQMHRKKNNLSVIECAGIYRTNDIQMKKRAKKAQRQQKLNNIIHIFKLGKLHN